MRLLLVAALWSVLGGCSSITVYEDDGNTCWSGRNGVTQCQENEHIVNPPIQLYCPASAIVGNHLHNLGQHSEGSNLTGQLYLCG